MNKIPTPLRFIWALWFFLLCAASASVYALPSIGTQLNNWCAQQPTQAAPPQQSRPYQAAGSACTVCHTSSSPSTGDLNTLGNAARTCTGTGAATVCGAAVNPFCIATPPSNASITAPPVGTTVAQNQSLTFTAANATNPDGFPLAYNWTFSSGQPAALGQSVAVPMTIAGVVTTTLRVLNSVGMLATGVVPTRAVTVTSTANQAPVATIVAPAANPTIAQGATVNFQGSGSDPDNNTPLTFAWTFAGGSPASSTAQNPGAVTYASAGTFTATLVVRDSLGLASASVTRTITVTAPANQAPVATISSPAANTTIAQGATVNFQGSGSDPDNNTPLTFAWTFAGGSPVSSTAQNPGAVTYASAGSFSATLVVRDSLGLASASVTRTITVTATNQAPVATISSPAANTTIAQGATVNFQGSGSDPDNNTPLTFAWTFAGGSPASSTAQNPGAVTYATAGTFSATLVVRDSLGLASASVTRTITVTTPANQAPVATINAPAANTTIARGGSVSFQGSGSDPDNNTPLTFAWTFPGGSPATSTAQNPGPVSYNTAGSFVATFTVIDSKGLASTAATRTITVTAPANQPPVATISSPAANTTIAQGATVNFQGSGSDPDNNTPLTFAWTFAGGSPASSTAQNPGAVTYATAGTFSATLVVRDSLGLASASVTRTITVSAPANQAPVATIVAPAANTTIAQGATVNFQGSGSDPDNNTPLTFAWTFPGGSPASSTAQNPGPVSYANAGTFSASLRVTDSKGLASATVSRSITVTATPNQPPVATIIAPATNVTIARGGTVSYQGSGSDPDNNTPLTFAWSFAGGSPASSTAQNPGAVTYSSSGTFTTRLTVTDAKGLASTTVTRTVTVSSAALPVASITAPAANVSVVKGGSVTFAGSGSVSDDDRLPLTYSWSFAGGTPASSTVRNPGAVTFNTVGVFTVSFTVFDRRGLASLPVTRTVTVTAPAQPPVGVITAPAANVTVKQGQTVNFQGSGSDPDNNLPLTYSWSFPGGTPASSTAQNPGPVRYAAVGTFTASFTVKDSTGLSSTPVTRTVTVQVANPEATIVAPAINVSILPGGTVNFQSTSTGAPLPLSYLWTFTGGSPSSSTRQNPGTVSYATTGSFTATLVVTDGAGRKSDPATRVVTVAAANSSPGRIGQCVSNGNGEVEDD